MTRASIVRAQVVGRPEPPFDRLFDFLTHEIVSHGALARVRFPVSWSERDRLAGLVAAKRMPLPTDLAEALLDYHQRLGASHASKAALERLIRGEAVCSVAGQQPAPLGGPLYALHKTAAAVGIARRVATRSGVPCVPLFWTHVDDSDFDEIRSIAAADATLALRDLTLPDHAHRAGSLVGNIAIEPLQVLGEEALARWLGLPGHAEVARLWQGCLAAARDLGELHSALMLRLFAEQGLVVVDPRLPAFRAAARSVIDRYLLRAEECSQAVRQAGAELEPALGRRPLADASLESLVFALEDGTRRKVAVAEARARGPGVLLSPGVALRPVVQDGVLPTVAMACGPGELAYLAQLKEAYQILDVRPACPVPRFGATWVPPAAVQLLVQSGVDPWELVATTDTVLRREAERLLPRGVRAELERIRADALTGLERFSTLSARLDASLPQLVESARGKIDYQFARLAEGLVGKSRHRLEREHPEWPRLRYYLLPGDKLQERRLASLEPVAYRGVALVAELCDLAESHAEGLEHGAHSHYLLEL
ncbi:MAG TPA: bacillithiol biosynthesis BshC [Candidatus Eisenbacteria bacterium]